MKRQIRSSVFETNSSSIHSIAIPRNCKAIDSVRFNIGEFGWEWDVADAANYLYTAICFNSDSESEVNEKIKRLKNKTEMQTVVSDNIIIQFKHNILPPLPSF